MHDSDYQNLKNKCCGGGCCLPHETTVNTSTGPMIVKSATTQDAKHLEEKVENATHIEIDGCGKVVEYNDPYIKKAEESYKEIVKPKKLSFWARIKTFFRRKKVAGNHFIKRA